MLRAAALRPINVTMLVIGVVAFATTLAWWLVPLTIVTYASLVFLAARDPIFQRKVLGGGETPKTGPNAVERTDLSPERRARWLPRGETRQKVEAALDVYRKVVAAVETSDDVTRSVLDDVVPRLHAAADRLVDVARGRERAAEVARGLKQRQCFAVVSVGRLDATEQKLRGRSLGIGLVHPHGDQHRGFLLARSMSMKRSSVKSLPVPPT